MSLARPHIRRHGRTRGFSLLEVMVSIIVICVGLLGIAKLQALSLSNTNTSRLRALAAIQAASLASAMHSNRQYWFNTAPASVTVTASSTTAAVASTDAALQTQATTDLTSNPTGASPSVACVGTSGGGSVCNALPLAAFDLSRWAVSLGAMLPNPSATISCPAANIPVSCTILITWTEKAVAVNKQETAAPPTTCASAGTNFQLPCYTLYVEP